MESVKKDKLNAPITENFSLKERLRILPKNKRLWKLHGLLSETLTRKSEKVLCFFKSWKSKTWTCKFSRNKIYNFAVLPIGLYLSKKEYKVFQTNWGIFSYLLKNNFFWQQHTKKIIIQRRQNVSRTLLLQNRSGVAQ